MAHIYMKRYLTLTVTRKMIMPLRDITLLDRTKIKNDRTKRLARKQKHLFFFFKLNSGYAKQDSQSREHFNSFKNVTQRNKTVSLYKYLCIDIHRYLIYSSWKMRANQSISQQVMGEQGVG